MIHHLTSESGYSWELQRQRYCVGMTVLLCAVLVFFFRETLFSHDRKVCRRRRRSVIVSTDIGTCRSYRATTRLNTRKITASNPSEGPGDLGDPESYRHRHAHTHTAAHIITQVCWVSVWVANGGKTWLFINQRQSN